MTALLNPLGFTTRLVFKSKQGANMSNWHVNVRFWLTALSVLLFTLFFILFFAALLYGDCYQSPTPGLGVRCCGVAILAGTARRPERTGNIASKVMATALIMATALTATARISSSLLLAWPKYGQTVASVALRVAALGRAIRRFCPLRGLKNSVTITSRPQRRRWRPLLVRC